MVPYTTPYTSPFKEDLVIVIANIGPWQVIGGRLVWGLCSGIAVLDFRVWGIEGSLAGVSHEALNTSQHQAALLIAEQGSQTTLRGPHMLDTREEGAEYPGDPCPRSLRFRVCLSSGSAV